MPWIRRLALPALLGLLCLGAAPAQATLLVRSDGNGLFVQDKNGLDDDVTTKATTGGGATGYLIQNLNFFDFFKFDRQAGCFAITNDRVSCDRNGPKIEIRLSAGNDSLQMAGTPAGDALVTGGTGTDTLFGHIGKDDFSGFTGDDTLAGGAGNDHLRGQDGADRLKGDAGADILSGGDGSDRVEGGGGDDEVGGSGGSDGIFGNRGSDHLVGGSGNDALTSKEGGSSGPAEGDRVTCGSGFDNVTADLPDKVEADCEEVDQSPVGETPHVSILGKTLRVASAGRVKVRLRCPRGVKALGCNGSLQLRLGRNTQASRSRKVRYKIRAGQRKTVTLQLSSKDVRTLRRGGRRGILTSVEKGRKGRKTTVRNPRLKLSGG